MARFLRSLATVLVLTLGGFVFTTGRAEAAGGNYVFQGGTAAEQSQVRQALNASSFNWSVVPGQVTIVITPTPTSEAVPGTIYLDPGLLDSGEFSWGVVQHEYAHQVDFALFDAAVHARLNAALGGTVWCYADSATPLQHNQYGCERFASTVAWAYWQSPENCMKPAAISGESGGMSPAAFKALMTSLLGAGVELHAAPAYSTREIAYAPPTTKAKPSALQKTKRR
jgi:hypothetical protein